MQPHHARILHGFDARSILLFATLTMGGTQAVLARSELAEPRATPRHAALMAPSLSSVSLPHTLQLALPSPSAVAHSPLQD